MESYRNAQINQLVYDRLLKSTSIVDVDDTISFLDECKASDLTTECRNMVEIDYLGVIRLRSIMCSICYKLFCFPDKIMLKHEGKYYCVPCKVDKEGERGTIRNFLKK